MDSIYKQYPVGSILLWRTGQRLRTEKRLGSFKLPEPDKDYPIDYVLDGQQRLTAIFTTFQRDLTPESIGPDTWLPIYYDFDSRGDAQDSRFVALLPGDVDKTRYFPLSTFLQPVEFSHLTRDLTEDHHRDIAVVQQRFLSLLLPVQTFETEDRTSVAIVFERVNRMGIPLDTYQLLTAWTWSDEFDLQTRFQDLAEEFADFGFEEVGDDSDLMLRCAAAVLAGEPSPASLVEMNGATVREQFPRIEAAVRRAIDFVRDEFFARHVRLLPYSSLLVPLAAFFAEAENSSMTDLQRETIHHWFWRSCFAHRYSGNPQRNIRRDIIAAVKLQHGESTELADVAADVQPSFFLEHVFSIRTVATKTLILMLASKRPLSFISGGQVLLEDVLSEPNRREYHHCYPRAYLMRQKVTSDELNALVNFAIISRSDNRTISDKRPSEYRTLMPASTDRILTSAILPKSLFEDDYKAFANERAAQLAEYARKLAGLQVA